MLGGLALPFAIAVGGVATMLVELGGFVLAENCVTGVQTAWARIAGRPRAAVPDAPIDAVPAIAGPLPDEIARAARVAERHR
jgi:hypothetical protein